MRSLWVVAFVSGLELIGFARASAADSSQLLTIEAVIVNESPVPVDVLEEALALATRIYAVMDIRIVWIDSREPSPDTATDTRLRLAVIVVPESKFGHGAHTMGFAPNGGTLAYIFYRRVEEFSQPRLIPIPNTLGTALAHELGHLLLPNRPHTENGIMRKSWDRLHELLMLRTRMGLEFSPAEAELIRSNIARATRLPVANQPMHSGTSRVRSRHSAIVRLIAIGTANSHTFRGIVETINASDGIVYVEEGKCFGSVRACVKQVTASPHSRFIWIRIHLHEDEIDTIATIAHELQHAIEILSTPAVTTSAAMTTFYRQEGATKGTRGFETAAAIQAGDLVRAELRARTARTRRR